MFHSSTQKSNWIFKDSNELANLRRDANLNYIKNSSKNNCGNISDEKCLTYEEERIICTHYEYLLKQFCGRFQPPITIPSVIGTSIAYFKRIYLRNSVMDYHPKDIL
jgi:cyclin H